MQELSNSQFLSVLKQHGIEIQAKGGRLQISAPVGALEPQLQAELVRRKPDLLAMFQEADISPSFAPLVPAERNSKIPQTHAQQGLWLVDHFNGGSVAYNIPEAFEVNVSVDIDALQKAIAGLLARHESLRTYFYEEEGELFQVVSPEAYAPLGVTDISTLPELDRDQALRRLIREEAQQPFDLRQAPLVRFHLFRLAEHKNVMFFNIHHIVADRRSLTILREELTALYQAVVKDEAANLPDLPVQYADYAIWLSQNITSSRIDKQLQYWKKKLAGVPPFLELPRGRPYPEKRTAWGATVPVVIPIPLRTALINVGHEEGASLFMTLLAAFAVLLYKQAGSEDFCIGSPFTYRKLVETERLIGLFVNMLVFRCEMGGEPTFRELLRRVRDTALEAYENSDVPFQKLTRALKSDMRSTRSAIFQMMFVFEAAAAAHFGSAGTGQLDTNPGTARYDLTLQLDDSANGISGTFEYCTDLFDEPSILELAGQFSKILTEVIRQPDQPISDIRISPGAGRVQSPPPDISTLRKPNGSTNKLFHWLSLRGRKN